jgi:hypothetical protein
MSQINFNAVSVNKHVLVLCNTDKSSVLVLGMENEVIDNEMLMKLIKQGLSIGVKVVVFAKDYEQLKSQYGEESAQTILNNCAYVYR